MSESCPCAGTRSAVPGSRHEAGCSRAWVSGWLSPSVCRSVAALDHERESHAGADGVQNRNAALGRGMEIHIPQYDGEDGLRGDTMAVEFDLTKLEQPDNPELIKVTVDCILLSSWYQRH